MKRWLPALLLVLSGCTRNVEKAKTPADPLFREVATETGLRFQHFTGATGKYYMPEIMGAGGALFDYDSDGDLDVYLVQGTHLGPERTPSLPQSGEAPGNRLFRNNLIPTGRRTFTDVTEGSGAGWIGYGMGAAVGDYDNDGRPDLYLTNYGPNVLLHNEGNGKFADVTAKAGVNDDRWSTSATFLDHDRDGDLDLFVANYVDFSVRGNKNCHAPTGELDYCTPRAYSFLTHRLFRNDGNGKFKDVSLASGIGAVRGPGLGAVALDANQDGWPDILVTNDSAANFLWVNQRNGTFKEDALLTGLAYGDDGKAKAGMGVTVGDFDLDSDEDVFVVNLATEGATLFRNDGDGRFSDASLVQGLGPATMTSTGFGTEWFDYDNDGWLDLFVANGGVTIVEDQRGQPYPYSQRNLLFRNPGPGTRFQEVTSLAGAALRHPEVGRGAAFGDVDNDGSVDILVTNNNGPARLLRNLAGGGHNWLAVRLTGIKSNRMALGARVGVFRRGERPLWRRVHTDASYLSASDVRVHFGLGQVREVERVEVQWPSGQKESWRPTSVNQVLHLVEGTADSLSLMARESGAR